MKNRFTFKRVKSGGIILAYKTELSNFVNIVESESEEGPQYNKKTYRHWMEVLG
jgi:hypothetical protein